MRKTDTLIIGATFLGIAYAKAHKNCLIIEKGEVVCSDFVGCADITPVNLALKYSTQTEALCSELKRRGLLTDTGNVHIYPISGVMSDYILKNKIKLIMDTRIVSIKKESEGYKVTVFSINGFDTVYADKIIDTSPIPPENICHPEIRKYINASVLSGGSEFENSGNSNINIKHGLYGQSVLSMQVRIDETYTDARRKLHDIICKYIKNSKIASFALEFQFVFEDKRIEKLISDGYVWIPSASYENFLTAFEGGALHELV